MLVGIDEIVREYVDVSESVFEREVALMRGYVDMAEGFLAYRRENTHEVCDEYFSCAAREVLVRLEYFSRILERYEDDELPNELADKFFTLTEQMCLLT